MSEKVGRRTVRVEHDPVVDGSEIVLDIADERLDTTTFLSYQEANELACKLTEEIPDSERAGGVEETPAGVHRCELCGDETEDLTLTSDSHPVGVNYLVCEGCSG